jgi:hypothetical protein
MVEAVDIESKLFGRGATGMIYSASLRSAQDFLLFCSLDTPRCPFDQY